MAFKSGSNTVFGVTPNPERWSQPGFPTIAGSSPDFSADSSYTPTISTATFDNVSVYGNVRIRRIGTQFQGGVGSNFGIHIGGAFNPSGESTQSKRFPFATDVPGTSAVFNPAAADTSYLGQGWSSLTHGILNRGISSSATTRTNVTGITRFPFAYGGNANEGWLVNQFNLTAGTIHASAGGNGMQSTETAFSASGSTGPTYVPTTTTTAFPLTTSAAINVHTSLGPTAPGAIACMVVNAPDAGYQLGGRVGPSPAFPTLPYQSTIVRFPFSSITSTSNYSALTVARAQGVGVMSSTNGYSIGGTIAPAVTVSTTNNIERFPFASATPVATATGSFPARSGAAGMSSTTHGFIQGGTTVGGIGNLPSTHVATINKLPFASDTATALHATNAATPELNAHGQASCVV
jgi:hypothetical protein